MRKFFLWLQARITDELFPAFGHSYFSTACLHGYHEYCSSPCGGNGVTEWSKKPGECKFCDAQCRCPCHKEEKR